MAVYGGLDISKAATGWGVVGTGIQEAGAWRCPIPAPFNLKNGDVDARYAGEVGDWYQQRFASWVSTYRPDFVAIEKPNPGMGKRTKTTVDTSSKWAGQAIKKEEVGGTTFATTHFLNGLALLAALVCTSRNIPTIYVNTSTWRGQKGLGIGVVPPKSVKDKSAWHKKNAKTYAKACGFEAKSGDAAEGFCLATYLRNQHEQPGGLFPGLPAAG
ncbi:MAG: hypothetical protein JJ979_24165 [Roseibium sp.]|nr:hypothetical protein [Roseibium sp.]